MATPPQSTAEIVTKLYEHHESRSSEPQPSRVLSSPPSLLPPRNDDIRAEHYGMLINGQIRMLAKGISSEPLISLKLSDLRTPEDNTVLHIAANAGQVNLIRPIIQHDNDILYYPNSNGDLPIHVAVRAGQLGAVKELVKLQEESQIIHNQSFVNQLERGNDEENNIALHIALENREKEMAKYLFDKCPQTFYKLNAQRICPLYQAIKAGFWDLVRDMIRVGEQEHVRVENALLRGKSVVHAALFARNQESVAMMINKYPKLVKAMDEKGRTTLTYAAEIGFLEGIQCLFQADPQEVLQPDMDGSFPIHKACTGGNVAVVKELLSISPDITKWLLNNKGQNILHMAASSGQNDVVRLLLGKTELDKLINMKDQDGNTPLHVATLGKHPRVVCALTWDPRAKLMLQNKQGFTALDLAEKLNKSLPSFEEVQV